MNPVSISLSFSEGFLTFISPCLLPMIPIYMFYLAGAADKSEGMANRKFRLIANAFGFVLGFTVIFVLLGATATSLGHFLRSHMAFLRKISGVVMVLFGLNFIGLIKLKFLDFEKRLEFKKDKLDFFSSIIFGIIFSIGWSPCIGQFLGSALLLAGNTGTMAEGIILLLAYSAGLGIPFIIVSVLFDRLEKYLLKVRKHAKIINIISGVVLIIAGILIFTDYLKYL